MHVGRDVAVNVVVKHHACLSAAVDRNAFCTGHTAQKHRAQHSRACTLNILYLMHGSMLYVSKPVRATGDILRHI